MLVPGIRLEARLGVTESERGAPQEIFVDVELVLDLGGAGATDDPGATVDYEEVCRVIEEVATSRPFKLIEAIAEQAAQALLARFEVGEARVRVRKPGALAGWGVPYAAVEVRRPRDA